MPWTSSTLSRYRCPLSWPLSHTFGLDGGCD